MFEFESRTHAGPCGSLTSIAMALLFGSCGFLLTVLKTAKGASENDPAGYQRYLIRLGLTKQRPIEPVEGAETSDALLEEETKPTPSGHALPLAPTAESVTSLCEALTQFGALLLAIYVCEFFPLFAHSPKVVDYDLFWAWTILLMIWGFSGIKQQKDTTILNRAQTEEWKGWMQWMFLLYHYYHAENVYNSIRVMITCYVWMTGFGNFSFFYMKRDFGMVRVLQMLFRLNFLVVCLCMTLGNSYMLYYICPLHTFFFFMVYAIMRIKPEWNHTKDLMRYKLMAAGVVVYFIWDLGPYCLWPYLFGWLPTVPIIGATGGMQWEWYFRSTLDHWSTFLGMIFALNYPAAAEWFKQVEELPRQRQWLVKGLSVGLILLPMVWWTTQVLPEGKFVYNQTNAYYSPLFALLGYIFIRNISHTMRLHFLEPLEIIGKTTLETYLLQHHLWLTSNAKTLLTLVPGMPIVNFVVVTCFYFAAARKLYRLTMTIRGMVLPDNLHKCYQNTAGAAALCAASLLVAAILRLFFTTVPLVVLLAAICLCGGALVFAVLTLLQKHSEEHHLPERSALWEQAAFTAGVVLVLYIVLCLLGLGGLPVEAGTCGPSPTLKPNTKICSMAHPGLGLLMLAVSAVMLYTRDNYLGIPTLVLYLCERKMVTFEQAYGPLLAKLGLNQEDEGHRELEAAVPDSPPTAVAPEPNGNSDKTLVLL